MISENTLDIAGLHLNRKSFHQDSYLGAQHMNVTELEVELHIWRGSGNVSASGASGASEEVFLSPLVRLQHVRSVVNTEDGHLRRVLQVLQQLHTHTPS